jgi:DnaJ domain
MRAREGRNPNYDLLGALPNDDADELRAAFRRAVKRVHPDINPEDLDAGLKIRRIVRANEILGDAEQRAAYGVRPSRQPFLDAAGCDPWLEGWRPGAVGFALRARLGVDSGLTVDETQTILAPWKPFSRRRSPPVLVIPRRPPMIDRAALGQRVTSTSSETGIWLNAAISAVGESWFDLGVPSMNQQK